MKLSSLVPVLGLLASLSAPASAGTQFLVDFEKSWDYGQAVDGAYAASGVVFTNMLGLSNTADFTYYNNAPSSQGVGFAQLDGTVNTRAYMNVADGVSGELDFFYASPVAIVGAIKAYSGLNGTGTLLGSFDLEAGVDGYDSWKQAAFNFSGRAFSFDFTEAANVAAFDNITALPEPGALPLVMAAFGGLFMVRRRR